MAVTVLDGAAIPCIEFFIGGGIATIGAAASAGLAAAALGRRVSPPGTIDVGRQLGLPPLPPREVVLYSSVSDRQARNLLRTLAAIIRSTGL